MMCGEEKNFPWCENPTADLLLLPNLQQDVTQDIS